MAYEFECKHLTKRFDNGDIATLALDDVNLHFAHGDFISIIGPSGSGKSTLLSLIGTLDRPTDGTLLFNGEPISTCPQNSSPTSASTTSASSSNSST